MKPVDIVYNLINKLWMERDAKVDAFLRGGGIDPRDIEHQYDFAIIQLRKLLIVLEDM